METDLLPQRLSSLFPIFFVVLLSVGCSKIQMRERHQHKEPPTFQASDEIKSIDLTKAADDVAAKDLETKIREADKEILKDEAKNGTSPGPHIPMEINRRVEYWIKYFTQKDRARFQRFINRGLTYRPMVHELLDERKMPRELYFLAMIESGFQRRATSPVGAGGIWQFMPGTGRDYGLTVTSVVDDRRDPVPATRAAIKYLNDLHNVFQSWYLAMAAYNAGQYRIMGAIRKGQTRNFWELVDKKVLPAETMEYVPKFIAATVIGRNPKLYGFTEGSFEPLPQGHSIDLPSGIALADLSRLSGISLQTLKHLNPELIRGITPQTRSGKYQVTVPKNHKHLSVNRITKLLEGERLARRRALASIRHTNSKKYYRVRAGDTLGSIAARHGVPIQRLKRVNKLKREVIYAGQKLKVAQN
jgi:membrane-bound lytic murein transglycosylase D